MDLIRRTVVNPKAVREMVRLLNEDIQMRAERCAPDLDEATARIRELQQEDANLPPIEDMNGILDHAPLATRVAWVRDLFERIDVDSPDEKAVAVWRAATYEGVNRSEYVYEWLRR
jgi:hypothetical protein